jgi:hypothetical protein
VNWRSPSLAMVNQERGAESLPRSWFLRSTTTCGPWSDVNDRAPMRIPHDHRHPARQATRRGWCLGVLGSGRLAWHPSASPSAWRAVHKPCADLLRQRLALQ